MGKTTMPWEWEQEWRDKIINDKQTEELLNSSHFQSLPTIEELPTTEELKAALEKVTTPTPKFEWQKQTQMDDAWKTATSQWEGYNLNADPFYQQMVNRYTKNAQYASEDAAGKAAALTGGYGNSYVVPAAAQAYNEQMSGLTDIAMDLYNNAYNRWRDERSDALTTWSLLNDERESAYNQYLIDNGLVEKEFDLNKYWALGLGEKLLTMSGDERLKFLHDQGFTDDQIKDIELRYFTTYK